MEIKKNIIALIPARLGSNRVKAKNLRLIKGKPLIYYVIDACKKVGLFTKVYVNSESDLFGVVAQRYGVDFYKRPPHLATSQSMIDEYLYDFLSNIQCDILAVVNPTSPFLKAKEIESAINNFIENDFDTQLACQDIQTHSFYNNIPINFSTAGKHPRSQDLIPIKALNFAVTIWKRDSFLQQFEKSGHAVYTGKLGLYAFHGLSTIDIDWEEDFKLAEIIMENLDRFEDSKAEWDPVLEDLLSSNTEIKN
ncbi:MAG TPA: acylneuraminate cytidylyltransferase family protein [Ignavibacteriaceae bacterium]|nr:acylneuraminate cytidylyltransferase family protein [Ignavibacteriaceae bacterium]